MPSCYVLDVGHGNAAVVVGDTGAVIVDGGSGTKLGDFLERMGLVDFEAILVSHADADHISGLAALLSMCLARKEMRIGSVYMNPDPRTTELFTDLLHLLAKLDKERGVNWVTAIGVDSPSTIDLGGCEVSVVAPSKVFRSRGIGGKEPGSARATANSLSAVVRVTQNGYPWILLPGDMDYLGFTAMLADKADVRASVVVYPHHGGQGGSKDQTSELVRALCEVCEVGSLVFSSRSGDSQFPSRTVLESVFALNPLPVVYSIGTAELLAEGSAFDISLVSNGTGTLHISREITTGEVSIRPMVSSS